MIISVISARDYKSLPGSSQYKFGVLAKIVKYMKVGKLKQTANSNVKITF